ncbi:hypothetical protein J7399_13275 [Shimia sp. R9_1]|uniref:tetratricopeptide repeat protein n=1 Tax=Shimia sp. R9_1 TaxID=2821111 RepID=UPI001AD979F6|nr:tetratricopeptide repeat protein [Shimia sp. R9_1]MBO9408404.1 hypothetical protein [Shimia sp. R9_1]
MSEYFDLGSHSRPASDVPEAQIWCDRGLIWLFAYNHEEAIVCFEKALVADPACALAHWGVAYGFGPNYNKPWEVFTPEEKAPALARTHSTPRRAGPQKRRPGRARLAGGAGVTLPHRSRDRRLPALHRRVFCRHETGL